MGSKGPVRSESDAPGQKPSPAEDTAIGEQPAVAANGAIAAFYLLPRREAT